MLLLAGCVSLSVPLASEAAFVLKEIQTRLAVDAFLCTGDDQAVAEAAAKALAAADPLAALPRQRVSGNMKPQDKAAFVRQLKRRYRGE